MQHYSNITDCIKMCERVLRNNNMGYPKFDFKPKFEANDFLSKMHEKRESLKASYAISTPETPFHPNRTIAVQNFQPDAETHVQSLVAMFGIMESCEIIKDDAPSGLAVVQYRSKTSAADALLAIPCCQVRGSNLVVHLLWNGPYESIDAITVSVHHSFKECTEKRVVCVGHLPRNISSEAIFRKCSRYGIVDDVKVQPQDQGAFAYVVFRNALSSAVATYCLRNSTTSSAALMLGYSENGSPVLLGPVRVRPLDQYPVPLSAFDCRCICTRFLDYSRFKGLFVNLQRKLPLHHFFRPGAPDYCVRIQTSQIKGVSLFIEILLFDTRFLKDADEITEMAYNMCNHKHLFRFSVDFGLHKPIMNHDDRLPRTSSQYLRWNSFFILDLQVCYPWDFSENSELRLVPRMQGMNHIYSDIDDKAFDDDTNASCWFGGALRHTTCNLSTNETGTDDTQHKNKMKFLVSENLPFVRLAGTSEDLNTYQIPVHVYSDLQSSVKN